MKLRWAMALVAAMLLGGCSAQQKAQANSDAQRAKQDINHALGKARVGLDNAALSAKVKTAMGASEKLHSGDIHVVARTNVVYLQGKATDAQQKALASRIAQDTVGSGIKVVNQLAVGGTGYVKTGTRPHARSAARAAK